MTPSTHNIKALIKTLYKIWKPDFRKTAAWLFITTGIVMISPSLLERLVMHVFELSLPTLVNADDDRLLGLYLLALGVLYHLWYGVSQDGRSSDSGIISWLIWVGTSALIALAIARLI